ncbi:MAG: class I SAM-dependent methyltransferase [Oscillatoriales cyanobacterium RU_3_3]|nr:class I SAM-dependent methyltransferase [Microcoleus sp. SM1_3_4]NJM61313.1 class I SAM-dependent methyltransferase [Oscillatoriales cyanobacterium RU_3_3]NJR21241.1 class I SAM-dependent methyltransferase [Richelia sp. CSU_2_1]
MTMQNNLQEQVDYYRARASEYDEWFYRIGRYDRGREINQRWFNEVAVVKGALHDIGKFASVLELACGTGIWTAELLQIGETIDAFDAAPEVIEINRNKLHSDRVTYRQIDLFSWEPDREYDLVFFAFWLSHVPPNLVDEFLAKVYRSVRLGGQVFIADSLFEETSSAKNHILEDETNIRQNRKLNDGREFQVFKVYYSPDLLLEKLAKAGFKSEIKVTNNYFIYGSGMKA